MGLDAEIRESLKRDFHASYEKSAGELWWMCIDEELMISLIDGFGLKVAEHYAKDKARELYHDQNESQQAYIVKSAIYALSEQCIHESDEGVAESYRENSDANKDCTDDLPEGDVIENMRIWLDNQLDDLMDNIVAAIGNIFDESRWRPI